MRRLIVALIAAAPLMTGCIIHDHTDPTPTVTGDIVFYWTFAGHTCSQTPKVDRIHITMSGPNGTETLPEAGYYKCSPAGVDGIRLTNYVAGSYTFSIDALDLAGVVVYTTTGTLRVTGPNDPDVYVDLAAVSSDGTVQVFWQFRDANNAIQPCAKTGIADATAVSKVRVYINNETPQDLDCTMNDQGGNAVQGWSWTLNAGSYQVTIDGLVLRDGVEEVWYSATQTVTAISDQSKNVTFDLLPVASGARFVPKLFRNGVPVTTCAAAGVKAFWIQASDYATPPNSTTPYWDAACDTILQNGFFWDYLPAFQTYDLASGKWVGTWTVTIEAWDQANSTHYVVGSSTKQAILTAGYKDLTVPIDIDL